MGEQRRDITGLVLGIVLGVAALVGGIALATVGAWWTWVLAVVCWFVVIVCVYGAVESGQRARRDHRGIRSAE